MASGFSSAARSGPQRWVFWVGVAAGSLAILLGGLLLAAALIADRYPLRFSNAAAWCFLFGIVLFSGSLYALAVTGIRKLGAITPIGGLLFLIGWGLLVLSPLKSLSD